MAMAQKTDKVYLKNGDIFTGEVYYMRLALLNFNMTSTGTIDIKWVEVVKISSSKTFEVTMKNGYVFVDKLDSSFFENNHVVLDDIVEIVQIEETFLQRLVGNIDLGFNYAKSNDILQFNFNSSTTYIKPKSETNLLINSNVSNQSGDSILSKNQSIRLGYLKQLQNNYNAAASLSWQQNTQLGLANRYLLAAAFGKKLIKDNHHSFLVGTGLSYNLEQSDQSREYASNLEALASFHFKEYKYLTPKLSIDALYTIYAGITDWGRIRMSFNLSTKYEVLKDFNIGLTFYDNYDSRPPEGALSKNDFGINFTLGYTFGK